jgi:poly-beta-1,6-N-acetyl-D-glucosamine synthase
MPDLSQVPETLPSNQTERAVLASGVPTRYAIVTPVRDEEAYIGTMIQSIADQTTTPEQWIIVDDGSRDRTAEIVTEYARRCPYIELVTLPARELRLAGGEGAIPIALQRLDFSRLDYLARFDADLVFPPHYIANLLQEFANDATLGIAGGMLHVQSKGSFYLESNPDFHVRGALKMYRRQCFTDIGGLDTQIGWDTIDEVMAWSKGWTTRSFAALPVIHRRPTGVGIAGRRLYRQRGRAEYFTCSHPLHVFARALRIVYIERSITKPVCYLAGFFGSFLRGEPRIENPEFIQARHAQQLGRLRSLFSLNGRLYGQAHLTPFRSKPISGQKG